MEAAIVMLEHAMRIVHGEVDNQPTTVDATSIRAASVEIDAAIEILKGSLAVFNAGLKGGGE